MEGYTLALEGSTYAVSVALLRGLDVIAERALPDRGIPSKGGREEAVLPAVAQCFRQAGLRPGDLARVACGAGPGGFTGLRVTASVAKGIAVGSGCALFAVSSLVLTVAAAPQDLRPGIYLSALPAMRGEAFAAPVEVTSSGSIRQLGEPRILAESEIAGEVRRLNATLVGPATGVPWRPHARGFSRLLRDVIASGACDIDVWEPNYGRLAEAQVRWEAAHGRPLTVSP